MNLQPSKMQIPLTTIVCAIILAIPFVLEAEEELGGKTSPPRLGFVDLFNGKDLTNWVDVNTSPDTWSVKDGAPSLHRAPHRRDAI